jgi:hypothetical protein
MTKLCTARERKTSGAKALVAEIRYGPLKPRPDTKDEFVRSPVRPWPEQLPAVGMSFAEEQSAQC